jgi:microcystin-dependent protein
MPIIISPSMLLPVPIVGVELGEAYAVDINNCMGLIDSHDHSFGKGVPITPNGLNINTNLTIQGNYLTNVGGITYSPLVSPSSTPDTTSVSGVDFYFTDGNGTIIRITESGGIAGSPGGIGGLTPPASVTYTSGNQTFTFQSNVNTAANLDAGSVTIREVLANAAGITLSSPSALASSYTLTLPPTLPSTPSFLQVDSSGNVTATIPTTVAVPSGSITMYGGTSAPTGYLLCDGTSYLQSAFPALFAAIGVAYGSADGTHFNVPDFRGIFPRGVSGTSGNDPDATSRTAANTGGNTGNNVGSFQQYGIQSHVHAYSIFSGATGPNNTFAAGTVQQAVLDTAPQGGNETRPVNIYVNFIIKT